MEGRRHGDTRLMGSCHVRKFAGGRGGGSLLWLSRVKCRWEKLEGSRKIKLIECIHSDKKIVRVCKETVWLMTDWESRCSYRSARLPGSSVHTT